MYLKNFWAVFLVGIVSFFVFIAPVFFGLDESEENKIEKAYYLSKTQFFTDQLSFRDSVISEYKTNFLSYYGSNPADSLFANKIKNRIEIKNLLPTTKKTFVVDLENHTASAFLLLGYDSLTYQYSIDEQKINSILNSENIHPKEFENILKYQDYIKSDRKFHYHLRKIGLTIFIGALIFLYFLIIFLVSINRSRKKNILSEEYFNKIVKKIKHYLDPEKKSKEEDSSALKEISDKYTERLKEIETELESIKDETKELFIIESMARKSELKMKEVGSRSNLMLVSGLIMAFIGLIIFYLTLPTNIIGAGNNVSNILSITIRPALILLFIESISWYLLRQHRTLLKDYKFFYSVYIKKINYLAAYKLIKESKAESMENILPAILLTEETKAQENDEKENQSENPNFLLNSLVEKLINKL